MNMRSTDYLFGNNCKICGTIPSYADDSTVVFSSNARQTNQEKLKTHLEKINQHLNNNGLAMNRAKTTINEIMITQKRIRTRGEPPTLVVKDENHEDKTLVAQNYTRLLGGNVGRDLSWRYHLELGDKAILPKLRKQLGALNLLGASIPMKSRLNLANSLLLSRMTYMIQIWGGTQPTYLKKVQVLLNGAARYVSAGQQTNAYHDSNERLQLAKHLRTSYISLP